MFRNPLSPDLSAALLTEFEKEAALDFLSYRPLHTVILAGSLREYGVINPLHRGTFYRTLDPRGSINGVALIGRNTCFEARTPDAVRGIALAAKDHPDIRVVFAEAERLAEFWGHFAEPGQSFRVCKTELLYEIHDRPASADPQFDLRRAGMAELDAVAAAHAAMVLDETGVDPLRTDASGFKARCAIRIEEGRVWVHMRDGKMVFKSEVVRDTPEVSYIEGLWVDPEYRGQNVARRCVGNLCKRLLNGSNAVCGFVDADNRIARSLYHASGFSLRERYEKYYI